MNINQLISIVKSKIEDNFTVENLVVEDKSFLHKKHKTHQDGKFHLKIIIVSRELKVMKKIESTKKIYSVLNEEIKKYIHSIQILIN
jgi:Stress-induced morphogen (activity unknown)|tara:strand:+ start:70 stop:330 length:261 start_codon:yes stop_codon:yes gene_type:complete